MARTVKKRPKQVAKKSKADAEEPTVNEEEKNETEEAVNKEATEETTNGTKKSSGRQSKAVPPAKKRKVSTNEDDVSENGVTSASSRRSQRESANKASQKIIAGVKKKRPTAVKAKKPSKPAPQFEVESILDSRTRKGKTEFKIRWKGYSPSSDTWEPERNLNCEEILAAFKAEQQKEASD